MREHYVIAPHMLSVASPTLNCLQAATIADIGFAGYAGDRASWHRHVSFTAFQEQWACTNLSYDPEEPSAGPMRFRCSQARYRMAFTITSSEWKKIDRGRRCSGRAQGVSDIWMTLNGACQQASDIINTTQSVVCDLEVRCSFNLNDYGFQDRLADTSCTVDGGTYWDCVAQSDQGFEEAVRLTWTDDLS